MYYDEINKYLSSIKSNGNFTSELDKAFKKQIWLILKENNIKDADMNKRVIIISPDNNPVRHIYIDNKYYCSVKMELQKENRVERYIDNKMYSSYCGIDLAKKEDSGN